MKEIIKFYSIADKDYHYEINDLFIVKYEKYKQTHLSLHTDDSCLTINILLSDTNEFTGGGTYFEDDIITHLNQGDAIIHSSQTKHAGVEITEGKRYLLVFFINIYKNT
jgi:predicted 2-oxoglutarate/Fe(II)-dependent dioxygenase YbiX